MRPGALIGVWVAVTAAAFWHFQGAYLLPRQGVSAGPGIGAKVAQGASAPTLLLFWNPECPCSQYEEGYVRRLADRFMPQGLRILTYVESDDSRDLGRSGMPGEFLSDRHGLKAREFGVAATPGCVVLDRAGRIVYRGSLHAGRFCDSEAVAFGGHAVEDLFSGRPIRVPSSPFYGCAVPN